MSETAPWRAPVLRQLTDDVMLVEAGGWRVLTEAACPHRKGRLRFGFVNGRTMRLTCPLHHSTFELLTGRQVGGPPCRSLQVVVLPEDQPTPCPWRDEGRR